MKFKPLITEKVGLGTVVACLGYATILFMKYNAPIIKQDVLVYVLLLGILAGIVIMMFNNKYSNIKWLVFINMYISLWGSAFIAHVILHATVVDYFQPFSLYDNVVYAALAGFGLTFVFIAIQVIASMITKRIKVAHLAIVCLLLLFIAVVYVLAGTQKDFEYTNTHGETIDIFEGGQEGYKTYRIPSVIVIPKGAQLADGTVISDDNVIVMAEARRNGSLDDGDIDLVQKISTDGGQTFSEIMIIRQYEDGLGKIGNPTPVFDAYTGQIILPHIAGSIPSKYVTYTMVSSDGGYTWSEPMVIFEGIVGPGHSIMIERGEHAGRLVVPGQFKGGSLALYSDNHGATWQASLPLDDGNECEIVELNNNGDLLMIVRTNKGVAKPHGKLQKLYVTSTDGGQTWSDFKKMQGIKEPICMSSIVKSNGLLYYSHPDDYYSRGQMTIAASADEGASFTSRKLIYQGASGYSDLAVTSEGDLLLVFENGSLEYDQRISLVKVLKFK